MTTTFSQYRLVTETATQARILQKLDRLFTTTKLERNGGKWTAPKIDALAEQIGVHKSTVSRAIKWLESAGLILVKRWRWFRSFRLYIRVLIRPRATSTQLQTDPLTLHDATCKDNVYKEKNNTLNTQPGAGPVCSKTEDGSGETFPEREDTPPTPPRRLSLRGKVRDVSTTPKPRTPPDPGDSAHKVALYWNDLLTEEGHATFDKSVIALTHVKRAMKRFPDLVECLPNIIGDWAKFAPKNAGKTPHPWAVLRAAEAYLTYAAARAAYAASGPTVEVAVPVAPPTPEPDPEPPQSVPEGMVLVSHASHHKTAIVVPADPDNPPTELVKLIEPKQLVDGLYKGFAIASDGLPDIPEGHPVLSTVPIALRFRLKAKTLPK